MNKRIRKDKKRRGRRRVWIRILVILIVAAELAGAGYYVWDRYIR